MIVAHAMTPVVFAALVLAALVLSSTVQLWLASRQIRFVGRHRQHVPAQFGGRIDITAHQRAADYTMAKTRLVFIDVFIHALVVLGFTLFGGLALVQRLAHQWFTDSPLIEQVAVVGLAGLLIGLVDLPMSWYRQFVVEQKFGFNRMTQRLFILDLIKSTALATVIGLPLVAVMIALMQRLGEQWWWWAWLVWVGFNLLALLIFPTLIAPLFNKFEPLKDESLRQRIQSLIERCGFRASSVMVMDGSKRSAHGNAYFTGLGASKRIVLFDTLLAKLSAPEIEAVLAHELGHFKYRHVAKRIVVSFVFSFAGLWLLGWLLRQTWFFAGLNVPIDQHQAYGAALVLFMLVIPLFMFPLQPLMSLASRKHEYQADGFAARQTRASDLVSALVKLYEDNASTLTPDPIHSAFYDSHPPAALRIARLGGARSP